MPFPSFRDALPALDVPFDPEVVTTRAVAAPEGLLVFFDIHQDTSLAPHSHGPQWGTVIAGELHLTRGGQTTIYRPGETYEIAEGEEHGAFIPAGSQIMDLFAEPDRYPVKR
ncbi:cupin domain-containing protein [Roseovarius faecimaris]|uniref:Cupin domain-containing protein n=1 Tax=Roseovarius faecimaris TaxID=2494550 RepID=A0A6I6IP06_9RHOB|nr:cupin domain-containing protein [Roseovarius faecimaris]QGX98415.1 cupin domain-containing protein [Roseovarius faecimaris]